MSDYYASLNDPQSAKDIAERFGFCLVKDVFRPDEIAAAERDLAEAAHHPDAPDLYSCPSLRWIMRDARIQAIAHALLGKTLVYYRETSLVHESIPGPATLNPYTEFHCDARGTQNSLLGGWDGAGGEIYPAYRFAVYFRNYRDYSGGLKVAVASHLRSMKEMAVFKLPAVIKALPHAPQWFGDLEASLPVIPFELFNIPSMPGDLVIFNLRCFHTAGAIRMRARPTFASLPRVEMTMRNGRPDICQPTSPGCRNAIFFDYGAPSAAADLYIKWRALDKKPASNAKALSYDLAPGMEIRNDAVIVSLAKHLQAAVQQSNTSIITPDDAPAEIREDMEILTNLCRGHREFSTAHPLFDLAAFERRIELDPWGAALGVITDIVSAAERLTAEEARLRTVNV